MNLISIISERDPFESAIDSLDFSAMINSSIENESDRIMMNKVKRNISALLNEYSTDKLTRKIMLGIVELFPNQYVASDNYVEIMQGHVQQALDTIHQKVDYYVTSDSSQIARGLRSVKQLGARPGVKEYEIASAIIGTAYILANQGIYGLEQARVNYGHEFAVRAKETFSLN